MPLINLQTDLKSIKYGQDRPGGGDSGLPYIQTDINTIDRGFNQFRLTKFDDGLIRGGAIGALNASITDTIRISKFLYTDQPKGVLFIAKQVGLQLSNPRLEVPKDSANILIGSPANALANSTNGLLEPTRIYNAGINTIAQIPVNAFGGHFSRHGILPVQNEASKYEAVVTANNKEHNRLVGLTNKFGLGKSEVKSNTEIDKARTFLGRLATTLGLNIPGLKPSDLIIDDYKGGPGSVYGILSRTTINRTLQITNDKSKIDSSRNYSTVFAGKTRDDKGDPISINYTKDLGNPIPNSSTGYRDISEYLGLDAVEFEDPNKINTINDVSSYIKNEGTNVINYGDRIGAVGTYGKLRAQVENQQKLKNENNLESSLSGSTPIDIWVNQFGIYDTKNKAYSSENVNKIGYKNSYGDVVTINKPNWSEASREIRVGSGRQDSINLTPLFDASIGQDSLSVNISGKDYTINDLVKFRIQAINTDNPSQNTVMVFRAYITNFEDSVTAGWNSIKYVGRGEEFYTYDGFTRKITIGFKVAALSAVEMQPMYQKLNYLMSNLMPDYNGVFMRGPFMRMTVGNWIDSQAGVINSLTYTVSNDSPWEIALNEPITGGIKEMVLPHIVDVSLSFTPIGIQTQGTDQLAKKSSSQTNIAQNWNGGNEGSNYINSNPIFNINTKR
jgi:hypothetical protein